MRMKNDLTKYLKKLRYKLVGEAFLKNFIWCATAASAFCLAVVVVSRFIFLPNVMLYVAGILAVATLVAAGRTIYQCPSWQKTACAADRLGGAERMITALELAEQPSHTVMEEMAMADGLAMAQTRNFAKDYSIQLPKRVATALLLLLLSSALVGFLPTPRGEEVDIYAEGKLMEVEKVVKELEKEGELSEAEQKAVQKVVKELSKELKQAESKKEAEAAVQQAQQKMKELEKTMVSEDLQKMAEAMAQNKATQELSTALSNADAAAIQAAMEKLEAAMAEMSEEELAELMEQLKELAGEMSDEELAKALEALASAIQSGAGLSPALGSLSSAAHAAASQNASLRQALQAMNRSLGKNAQAQAQAQGQGEGEGQGEGQGEGEGEGQGEGQGQGQGAGQGAGAGSGQGRGTGHVEGENIFTRNAEGLEGYETQVSGAEGEGGQLSQTQERIYGEDGTVLPYTQVYQSYKNDAMKHLDEQALPYGMKELVSEYFSTLEK